MVYPRSCCFLTFKTVHIVESKKTPCRACSTRTKQKICNNDVFGGYLVANLLQICCKSRRIITQYCVTPRNTNIQ